VAKDLIVKIDGETKGLKKAFNEAEKDTEKLQASLESTAKGASLAFAAFTGSILGSIYAFDKSQESTYQLNQALQNQGIYTEELSNKYVALADAIEAKTKFETEDVVAAQAQLQTMLGQVEVSEELTRAVVDLAAAKEMDLVSAANMVGKSISTETNALVKMGIEIDNTLEGQARMEAITKALSMRFDGQAEAVGKNLAPFRNLGHNVGTLVEALGEQLLPKLQPIAEKLAQIVKSIADNKPLVEFGAKALLAGAAITGLVAGVATLGIGFLKVKAIMIALSAITSGLTIGFATLAGATGIGLVLVAVGMLAADWEGTMNFMRASAQFMVTAVTGLFKSLGDIIQGIFNWDEEKLRAGIQGSIEAVKNGSAEFTAIRKEQADKELAIEAEKLAAKEQMEMDQANRRKEVEDANNEAKIEKVKNLQERMAELEKADKEAQLQAEAEFQYALNNVKATIAQEDLERDRAEKLIRATEEEKYGARIAGIRAFYRSTEYKATSEALGNLSTLTQTKNKQLFAIGKAAAIASAVMSTAQGVTRALAEYPPPFSFVAAGAQAAAGLVQINTIKGQSLGMAEGGLVQGGIPGVDSVPAMLQRGELVAPRENFDEVVNAVARSRAGAGEAGSSEVVVELRPMGGFMDYIETQIIERRRLGIGMGV
jgi:hypothetical protein